MRKYSNVVQEDGSRGISGVGPGIYRVSFYEFISLLAKGLQAGKLFRRCWLETALLCTNHAAFCKCILFRKIRLLLSTSEAMVKIKQHSGGHLPEFCKQWVPIKIICRITIPLTTSVKFFYTNNALFQIHFPPKSNIKIS